MSRRPRNRVPQTPPVLGEYPVIAILGRPNVGKSTLFNRLLGRRMAIVEDRPGVTRDRLMANADIDRRRVTLMDMGGFEASPETPIATGISKQCIEGLSQADLILFVVDGRVPPTTADFDTVKLMRKTGLPHILVVNKVDSVAFEYSSTEVYSLGVKPMAMISALHGRGISDLEDFILAALPPESAFPLPIDETDSEELCKVAIIGRPNAGKSSLVNRLLGENRLLTQNEPGTTRDPVDTLFEHDSRKYVLIDTAGIRRKRSVEMGTAEKLAVSAAVKVIERSHVVVLVVDCGEGMTEQDAKVLGLAMDRGRAIVLALNKWDLVKKEDDFFRKHLMERSKDILSFSKWLKVVKMSALTGYGQDKLLTGIDEAFDAFCKRASTSDVNRLFEDIIDHHPPALHKGKAVRLYYATQVSIRPPTFVVISNYPEGIHFSYKRYVENRIRESFGFEGTSIRVYFRQRGKREANC